MYYRATEDLHVGDHVAVVEKPNKIGKCNDPAAAGYLGILREPVSAGKKVEDIHITSLESSLETNIKIKQGPPVRTVSKTPPAEDVLINPPNGLPLGDKDAHDDGMASESSGEITNEDNEVKKKPWWRWRK